MTKNENIDTEDEWFIENHRLWLDFHTKQIATLMQYELNTLNYFLVMQLDCIPLCDLRWYWQIVKPEKDIINGVGAV